MNIGIGGIVSLGGGSSSSGGGGSGIQSINSQTGPAIAIVGVNGIQISSGGNTIVVNAASLSGLIGNSTQSGVLGVNGITVHQIGGNFIVDGAALSGISGSSQCYSQDFVNLSSVTCAHNFGTLNVLTQVFDTSGYVLIPDTIQASNPNTVIVGFNAARSGKIVIHGCSSTGSTSGVNKISQSFTNVSSVTVSHFLGTEDVIVQVRNDAIPPSIILPDSIDMISANALTVSFNSIRSGRITIIG